MQKGKLLLASSGKEFSKLSGILSSPQEVRKAGKEAMGRLGLDFLHTVGDDDIGLEKELAADTEPDLDAEIVKVEDPPETSEAEIKKERSPLPTSTSGSPVDPSPSTPTGPSPSFDPSALSARERNRLKRKRKPGNSAFVVAPPSQGAGTKYTPITAGSNK
jgi:TATA-binding protein-associated factor